MFTKLTVDYYGAPTPLQQLASFQTPEARTILITPFDKSSMAEIEKTLRDSRPRREPHQRRQRHPRGAARAHRGAAQGLRQARPHQGRGRQDLDPQHPPQGQGELDQLVKDGEVGEDEGNRAEKELEATTKKYVDTVDDLLKHKETELLEV